MKGLLCWCNDTFCFLCIKDMAVTDFSKVDSALRFLLDEAGVSAEAQKKIYDAGFDTLRSFACLDETSTAVRAALKQCGLDAEASLATRKDVALIVSAWESAKLQRTFQDKNKEEARVSGQPRLVQTTEYAAMRAAVEKSLGSLKDKEAPSKSLVASKLEQVEDGAPIAEDLRDATSFEDGEGEAYSAVIDPSTATLRIRPGRCTTTPPRSPEELRLRHRRLGLAWAFIKTRHSNRAWVPVNIVECSRKLSDHVLGSTVAGLRGANWQSPTWSLVLTYELELRKAAYRYVRDGVCACLETALDKACEAPALYSVHFVTPLQLGKTEINMELAGGDLPEPSKGKGKGKGKWERQWGKAAKAPDGRRICFAFNKSSGCDKASCAFAHICQRCFAKHSFQKCKYKHAADMMTE